MSKYSIKTIHEGALSGVAKLGAVGGALHVAGSMANKIKDKVGTKAVDPHTSSGTGTEAEYVKNLMSNS